MSNSIRVKDEKYDKVSTGDQTEAIIYANPDQEEIYANDDDAYVNDDEDHIGEPPYSNADEPDVDEMYVNAVPDEDNLYTDVGPSEEPELYIDPEIMNKKEDELKEELYENPNEREETKPEDELYVIPERVDNIEDDTYVNQGDDQAVLLDHEGRGYERMKKGVSMNDLNAEYDYATKQEDNVRLNSDGYQVLKADQQTGVSQQQPSVDEEYVEVMTGTTGEDGYRESQIYSDVQ